MSRIFLSHTSIDKPFVRKLAADLRRYGHTVWIDEAEINIGDSLINKIREGIDSVDFVAVVLSKASINSEWVKKEIEIASTREIEEKKIVVLPLIIENVELPGFLKGKFYGDFSTDSEYDNKLKLLLRSFPDSKEIVNDDELTELKKELAQIKSKAESYLKKNQEFAHYNLLHKSEKLKTDVVNENKRHPEYEPINNVYAFEIGDGKVSVTLGYLLWAVRKAMEQGSHAIEVLLSIEDKWDYANRMLEAYKEMLDSKDSH